MKKPDDKLLKKAEKLFKSGKYSNAEIGRKVGKSGNTINKWSLKYNWVSPEEKEKKLAEMNPVTPKLLEKMKAEYLQGGQSLTKITEKYEVSYDAIKDYFDIDKWREKQRIYLAEQKALMKEKYLEGHEKQRMDLVEVSKKLTEGLIKKAGKEKVTDAEVRANKAIIKGLKDTIKIIGEMIGVDDLEDESIVETSGNLEDIRKRFGIGD